MSHQESMYLVEQDVLPQDKMEGLKARIAEMVYERGAVKACQIMPYLLDGRAEFMSRTSIREWCEHWEHAVELLIAEGKIIELEYIQPNMPYRVKTILFPAGTEIKFHAK